jgi:ketosteroid isomerase-like protein
MSQENVEIVRLIYSSLTRGGDGLMELVGPDFVVDFSRRRVDPFVETLDQDALDALRPALLDTWEAPPTWEPQELVDAGDKVFAFIRTRARGRASGVEVDAQVANVWTFRDGKPVEFKYFGEDRAAALEAAGLAE